MDANAHAIGIKPSSVGFSRFCKRSLMSGGCDEKTTRPRVAFWINMTRTAQFFLLWKPLFQGCKSPVRGTLHHLILIFQGAFKRFQSPRVHVPGQAQGGGSAGKR